MDGPSQDLRRRALRKIAVLSTTSTSKSSHNGNIEELCKALPHKNEMSDEVLGAAFDRSPGGDLSAQTPMTTDELHILLALCGAASQVNDLESAERLLQQLRPYVLDAHRQTVIPSPFLSSIEPSPWEALTYNLLSAVLAIGIKHLSLHESVFACIHLFLEHCNEATKAAGAVQITGDESIEVEALPDTGTLAMAILGFMEAAAALCQFFTTAEKLEIARTVRGFLNERFMVAVEGTFSSIRTSNPLSRAGKDWKSYIRHYASSGRPLGAMLLQQGFMRFLVSCSSLQLAPVEALHRGGLLDILMSRRRTQQQPRDNDEITALVEELSAISSETMRLLEDGADYLQLGSAWQHQLAFSVKGYALIIFLGCVTMDEEIADVDTLLAWLDDALADPVQMSDDGLATVVLKSLAILAQESPAIASNLSRSLPRFIVQGGLQGSTTIVTAQCLSAILQLLSQDAVITGLYSLGNVLSASSASDKGVASSFATNGSLAIPKSATYAQLSTGSSISLDLNGDEEASAVYVNVVRAVVAITIACVDRKVVPLAQSMLLQKLGRISMVVDLEIIIQAAVLGASGGEAELKSLLKLYDRLSHQAITQKNDLLLDAIMKARIKLADNIPYESPLFQVYILHLLETIVGKGDIHEQDNTHQADVELAALEISQLLKPLSLLSSTYAQYDSEIGEYDIAVRQREAWFNIVVHGIIPGSALYQKHVDELRLLACSSRALVAENRTDQLESDIELNTVLRRGMNGSRNSEMKAQLIKFLPSRETRIKSLSYPQVIFFHAAYILEALRAEGGDCAKVLTYFTEPSISLEAPADCMKAIADQVMNIYLRQTLSGLHAHSSAHYVANQLAKILTLCCHRILKCQQMAAIFAERLVAEIPSSLCQKTSLFALLELMTLMWSSCLEAEVDEYEWKSHYTSARAKVSLQLSDDFAYRQATLNDLHKRARTWVTWIINIAPLDVKGLLQTYLSEFDDEGAYGHIALGRSFALEMGSAIPTADYRLRAIDDRHGDFSINTASDFIAQYTTRQEYKYADALPDYEQEWLRLMHLNDRQSPSPANNSTEADDAHAVLTALDSRLLEHKFVTMGEIRDILRRAAALLCRSKFEQCAIIHRLVNIPFRLFTKQSIQLGVSLWLGVINENPRMEPRILFEIAKHWEDTVLKKVGIFGDKFHYLDPFYIKEEFAPSDRSALSKRQQAVHNLIAPHLRILQFLSSHFNAYRFGSTHLRRVFQQLISVTLRGLRQSDGHPLTREFHFQFIYLALNVLRYSDELAPGARWKLKDRILSAALSWFSHSPRWSFGGNRLQIKAECQLMVDIERALVSSISQLGFTGGTSLQSLAPKQELLVRLLENEHTRLQVWLSPTSHDTKHFFSTRGSLTAAVPISMAQTAWSENPKLAVQLASRYQLPLLSREVRRLLLEMPEKAIEEPEALQIMFENGLPRDVTLQAKYLLYWAPVNPISAVTYFAPSYSNHPYVIQYAMRALESHSVDITFFYVPQIVQTLRYDSLGYVQRYIIETAKFSQLFAHQIIWNMKANAYKDEDSTIEDPLKPTLDKVMENMIASFSDVDKAFYEKEFSFFNEITDISGKLRPYIKREKAEKKAKIEEELRKIKVEVGVYLPSNPDGVVVGIDRKSGKPLQSHAKAPYMATFRIRKNKGDQEDTENMLEKIVEADQLDQPRTATEDSTYEVWQSAIFKVGDDCRQDVLALQMIAAFRGIFNNVGLDVFVYPYRVTATAPGCGVIDVLPNSISRDMVGREAVNGLLDYFVSKYGSTDSIRFQEARNNFVKSMAPYSMISYLLQFKDRHNGNIMIDDAGHILHIDFGFCFDIAPGGIKFERAPFKLTTEMVAVMGGHTAAQSYKWFEALCIKAFLAARPYTEKLCHMVMLMLDSGLPCFKPETIAHFRERMVLEKSEREAADFMKELIRKSYASYSTKGYDQFQLLTNGIPY